MLRFLKMFRRQSVRPYVPERWSGWSIRNFTSCCSGLQRKVCLIFTMSISGTMRSRSRIATFLADTSIRVFAVLLLSPFPTSRHHPLSPPPQSPEQSRLTPTRRIVNSNICCQSCHHECIRKCKCNHSCPPCVTKNFPS